MSGIFGIESKNNSCIDNLLTGLFSLQHRGESFCGIVTKNKKYISFRHEGKVLDSFTNYEIKRLKGNQGIGNVNPLVKQPISFDSNIDELALTYSGKLLNKEVLARQLKKRGHSLSLKHSDVEIIGKLMSEKDVKNVVDGLEKMAHQAKGVYSLGVLAKDGIYVFRSPVGVEPLVIGENNNIIAFSSESCALKEIGLTREDYRDVKPGEIIRINKNIETLSQLDGKEALCAFEPGYWARIDSIIDNVSVKLMREACGQFLAQDDEKIGFKPDIIIPIRDSGVGAAIGYHHYSGVPYEEGLFKNWYITRTYIQPNQKARIKGARRKQSTIEDAVKGKIIVVIDDSFRRGTTILGLIDMLRKAGAKEVHVRSASPENIYNCRYNPFSKKPGELLASKKTLEEQKKYIGADSLKYNSTENYLKSIGIEKEKLCTGCWTKEYPI